MQRKDMTPPLCWCCKERRVARSYSRTRPHQVTPDGLRWRRYCSLICAAKGNGSTVRGTAAIRSYLDGYRARVLARILETLKPHVRIVDGEPLIAGKPLVRFILAERREAYARGSTATYLRYRRGKAA